jgi:dinuclear metal center YbgI/SA1388 family protein
MIQREELVRLLDSLLNANEFSDYGPNGLQIEGENVVKKIAFAVSATLESIQQAIDHGADTLIVHHGVFWKHSGARPLVGAHGERVKKIVQANLNLIAYHLPLDAHLEYGNASGLASALGLESIQPFGAYKNQFLGVKGSFGQQQKVSKVLDRLEQVLGRKVIHSWPDSKNEIKSIGIITGGANNQWELALEDGLDAYITGEISEYNWHDAKEAGIHYFAGGHHATERFGVQSLKSYLENKFKVSCAFFDSDNPV